MQNQNHESDEQAQLTQQTQLTMYMIDKLVDFIEHQRKEEIEYDIKLEEIKSNERSEFKKVMLQKLIDSGAITQATDLLRQYLTENSVYATTPPQQKASQQTQQTPCSEDAKSDLTSFIIVRLKLNELFLKHSKILKSKLSEKSFELLKNIFKSVSESDFISHLEKFKTHTFTTIDLSSLYKFYLESLDDNEKEIINAVLK